MAERSMLTLIFILCSLWVKSTGDSGCRDKIPNCAVHASACYDDSREAWVKTYCPRFCSMCDTDATTTTTTTIPKVLMPCKDVLSNCRDYGETACYEPYLEWAEINCPLTCSLCDPDKVTTAIPNSVEPCGDAIFNCDQYGPEVCKEPYLEWAKINCPVMCGFCNRTTQPITQKACRDILFNCRDYGASACLPPYKEWAQKNCASFCGLCDGFTSPAVGVTKHTTVEKGADFCIYKDKHYRTGEQWVDGCDYNCTCINAHNGYYKCKQICPQISHFELAGCTVVKKAGECCGTIECPERRSTCNYKGKSYTQGQTWNDGCAYECTCVDERNGFYQCKDKCPQWNLPSVCTLQPAPTGKCCKVPNCPAGYTINYPPNYIQE